MFPLSGVGQLRGDCCRLRPAFLVLLLLHASAESGDDPDARRADRQSWHDLGGEVISYPQSE